MIFLLQNLFGKEAVLLVKKGVLLSFATAILVYMVGTVYLPKAHATDLAEGTYAVGYEMLQAENDSVSIANDYFEKPATLTIDKDGQYIQFTVNHSEWVKVIQAKDGESFTDVQIVSEDLEQDTRVVAFKVDGDIAEPLLMQMHVVIEEMEPKYDHKYTVRLALDVDTLEATDAPAVVVKATEPSSEEVADKAVDKQDEPIGNALIYSLLAALLVGAIILIVVVNKARTAKKS
ncbi:NEAT domain-containing protein [Sporosarcina sp. FSL K6-1522]|uniref:NEAT domain-containing protein n=1 Tax=Sporosarcina sp. FSL K6-1522 TaxID=2921554 RepID=UPI00315A2AC5